MERIRMTIPGSRLPPGFLDTIDSVPERVADARPAATAVLMRDGEHGLEVLLLRRSRTSGFVPGAYVFPGGRVDPADSDPRVFERASGELPAEPAPEYWAAALREVFEETGVLLAVDAEGGYSVDAVSDASLEALRVSLLEDRASLLDVLERRALRPALDRMVYVAHWITPEVEPRRFDTRFFLAALPPGRNTTFEPREMSDAVWLAPAAALERFAAGTLPMVFPTVRTLESVAGFENVAAAFQALRGRTVRPLLPRLVRTPEGVGLVLDDED
jgi:8-oxo-dGTP pyrophosphatase MutT (NUDIX family)